MDLDLLIVPSMTKRLSGHARVFDCAKARAVEMQTIVCAVGCIGTIPCTLLGALPRPNTGGAAVFLPCEPALGYDGIMARSGPFESGTDIDPMLYVADVPIGKVRHIREHDTEVWPGAWNW